ncbi:MAG: histidine phosphatase family protein [Rhizobiaceae bacterium]|nr:histidine phosphatase family protein [Rhizobiaceae bacterium]
MKTLLLFRHAKSSRDDAGLRDYDRPLAERGLRDAPRMGDEIARRGWVPDITLVSAARRTRATWMLASKAMGAEVPVTFLDSIYEAEWQTLLAALRAVDPAINTALMVGHNPGMEDLALELAGGHSSPAALEALGTKFPTAAVARLEFDGQWAKLTPGGARLVDFVQPRDIKSS